MEALVKKAMRMIIEIPGKSPRIFIVAGKAMIPAPMIVVARLKTAPLNEAPLNSPPSSLSDDSCNNGALTSSSLEMITISVWVSSIISILGDETREKEFVSSINNKPRKNGEDLEIKDSIFIEGEKKRMQREWEVKEEYERGIYL